MQISFEDCSLRNEQQCIRIVSHRSILFISMESRIKLISYRLRTINRNSTHRPLLHQSIFIESVVKCMDIMDLYTKIARPFFLDAIFKMAEYEANAYMIYGISSTHTHIHRQSFLLIYLEWKCVAFTRNFIKRD